MKKLYTVIAALLVVLAAFTVTSASWILLIHQPKVPKSLLK